MAAIETVAMGRFFSPASLAANPPAVAWARRTLLATDPVGYAGCCAAIRDMDITRRCSARSASPTLVICGNARRVDAVGRAQPTILARAIAGARGVRLPTAHISNLERPRSFTAALFAFLAPPAGDPLEAGSPSAAPCSATRTSIARSRASTEFTRDFQELITRTPGARSGRGPGLDRRTRRLLVLAMTAALGRWEEFRLHVRTGLAGRNRACDSKEILLQVAVYAGVPAANTAFHIAAEELARAAAG